MKKLLYLFVLIFLVGCGSRPQLKREFEQLFSQEIILPANAFITYNGKDTVINDFFDGIMKQVVFVDSVDCNACVIEKLKLWQPIFDYSEKLDNIVSFYFILSPNKDKLPSVRSALMSNPIYYPVVLDVDKEFMSRNPHIPKNKAFHTFLLDSENNVLMAGSPIASDEINQLFYKVTQEKYREVNQ